MGNAAIWWQPRGAAVPRKIDLGRRLQDLQERIVVEEAVAEAYSGVERQVIQRSRNRVRFVTGRSMDWVLAEEVRAALSSVAMGGRIALAADDAQVFGAFLATPPDAGQNQWWVYANLWERYSTGTPPIGSGARVTLISPSPAMRMETVLLTAAPAQQLYPGIQSSRVRNSWTGLDWVFAREYRFFPVLKRAIGDRDTQAFLHEEGRSWWVDATFDEDMAGYAALALTPETAFAAPTAYGAASAPADSPADPAPSPLVPSVLDAEFGEVSGSFSFLDGWRR